MMRGAVCASALLVLLASLAAIGVPVKFTTIDRGNQSNIDDVREVSIRAAAEWTALWREHAGDHPLPAVDFTRSTVVGVFLGSRPTAGFDVEITGIEKDGADLIVTWREIRPERGAMLAQILTMPFHIVSTDKHAGPIKFRKSAG
jgi:hypothetical protein